jgi:hypothetical protein
MSFEDIRRNWSVHPRNDIFEEVYNDIIKMYLDNYPNYTKRVKNFIQYGNSINNLTLSVKNHDKHVNFYHICNIFGLSCSTNDNFINISKPDNWNWEFSSLNPALFRPELCIIEKREISESKNRWLLNKYCYSCNKNGFEIQLFSIIYT